MQRWLASRYGYWMVTPMNNKAEGSMAASRTGAWLKEGLQQEWDLHFMLASEVSGKLHEREDEKVPAHCLVWLQSRKDKSG